MQDAIQQGEGGKGYFSLLQTLLSQIKSPHVYDTKPKDSAQYTFNITHAFTLINIHTNPSPISFRGAYSRCLRMRPLTLP